LISGGCGCREEQQFIRDPPAAITQQPPQSHFKPSIYLKQQHMRVAVLLNHQHRVDRSPQAFPIEPVWRDDSGRMEIRGR